MSVHFLIKQLTHAESDGCNISHNFNQAKYELFSSHKIKSTQNLIQVRQSNITVFIRFMTEERKFLPRNHSLI